MSSSKGESALAWTGAAFCLAGAVFLGVLTKATIDGRAAYMKERSAPADKQVDVRTCGQLVQAFHAWRDAEQVRVQADLAECRAALVDAEREVER